MGESRRGRMPVDRAWDRTRQRSAGSGLVGRDAELAALMACCARAAGDRRGAVAIVEGDHGIGASTLLAELVDRAAAVGFAVLVARAEPRSAWRPLGVLADLLASSVVLALDRTVTVEDRVVDTVAHFGRPAVLVVEDCHHADPDTAWVLAGDAGRLLAMSAVVVLSTRPRANGAASVIAGAVPNSDVTWLRLGPLTDDDLASIVTGITGGRPGPRQRAAIAGSGGNPRSCVRAGTGGAVGARGGRRRDDREGELSTSPADRLARRSAGAAPWVIAERASA